MKISIVIPAFNEEKLIVSSLRSVKEASAAFIRLGWDYELIVCNNNSTDATGRLAEEEGVTVVFEPVNQFSRARNTGAAMATGDWLLFIDADAWPTEALFAEVAQHIQSGRCLAGGVTGQIDFRRLWPRTCLWVWNNLSRLRKLAAGWFLFCEAAAFRELGGYNEVLYATEDIDISIRFRRLARRTGREMVILHRHPLRSSARKEGLYSPWTHAKFLLQVPLTAGRSLTKPDGCPLWYDGKR